MNMKFIINESQLNVLNEAVGVPDNILDAAEKLYGEVEKHIKKINYKNEEYEFKGVLDVEIGDKKKIKIDDYQLTVEVREFDEYNDKPQIIGMGVSGNFVFDRDILKKKNETSRNMEFQITFAVSEGWEPYELYEALEKGKDYQIASLAHELKHKYDKQVKKTGLVGHDAEYQATLEKDNFGIPVIDNDFFRYMYFTTMVENLVRPTEVASQMKTMGITKSGFRNFLENERVYKELLVIREFTFDYFIGKLKEEMDRVDELLYHIGENPEDFTEDEKIKRVLEIVYISIVNTRMKFFINMTSLNSDDLIRISQDMGMLPRHMENDADKLKKVDEVRQKFLNFTIKYQNNPIKFFQDECKKITQVADKMIRKIAKLHSLAKNDETQMSESIQNWELHQKLMEKKYGKRKISTTYDFKDFK